jgi:hypothetical protein
MYSYITANLDKFHGKSVKLNNGKYVKQYDEIERYCVEENDNKVIMCTDIDIKFNLYENIVSDTKIKFNKKNMFNDFFDSLEEKKVKYEKKFYRKRNQITHIFYVPVTHSVSKINSVFCQNYDVPKNLSVVYIINIIDSTFCYDNVLRGKDMYERCTKFSKKNIKNIELKQQMKEYYDDMTHDYIDHIYYNNFRRGLNLLFW